MANLIQFKRGNSASLPTVAEAGEPLFTTDTGRLYIGTGTGVTPIGAANANEIVLTPVGSISSINVQAAINELDNEKASLSGATFTGPVVVQAPSADNSPATKAYVDAKSQGLSDFKDSVRVATTGSITLSGLQTIDGITLLAGDRVLVKDQANEAENGIYIVSSDAWGRSADANSSFNVSTCMFLMVDEGSTNIGSQWVLSTTGSITVGTTNLHFTQFSRVDSISAGNGLIKETVNSVSTMSVKAHPGTANTIGQVIVNELGVGVVLGTTATTAAAGNHTHSASNVGALSSSTTSSQSGYFTNINLLDSTSSLYYLKMGYSDSTLTATRLLTFSVENADRHLTIRSNAIIAHDTHENSIAGHTWFTKSAIEGLLTGIITSHTHADATISTDGFMSAEDKTKLDSLNNYTHPTTDGYLHVPATGTSNNNKVLKAGATAGSLSWGSIDWSELTNVPTSFTPSAHTHDDLYMALGVTIDGGTW